MRPMPFRDLHEIQSVDVVVVYVMIWSFICIILYFTDNRALFLIMTLVGAILIFVYSLFKIIRRLFE